MLAKLLILVVFITVKLVNYLSETTNKLAIFITVKFVSFLSKTANRLAISLTVKFVNFLSETTNKLVISITVKFVSYLSKTTTKTKNYVKYGFFTVCYDRYVFSVKWLCKINNNLCKRPEQ